LIREFSKNNQYRGSADEDLTEDDFSESALNVNSEEFNLKIQQNSEFK